MMALRLFIILTLLPVLYGYSQDLKVKYAENLSKDEQYCVILMGGQSNMVGRGKQIDLDEMMFSNISFFDFGLSPGLINPKDNFGPEIGISMQLSKNNPNKKFILIKYAIGGASLLDWAPNYSKDKAEITGNPQFGSMYNRLIKLTDSLTEGLNAKVKALIWMQGERDARIPEAGKDYYGNFEKLINSVRIDYENQEMPIIFGKINPPKAWFPALDNVVDAQIRISEEIPNTYFIDTDSLEKLNDDIHYSSNGQINLGIKFGEKISELLKN
ncbi:MULTISPECIES: sialate O-acetylesterase [Flavobacteriaceae]|jgi:hypothetical protein|uniref:Sialate O-acetylesterase n=4 Tax=Flavobacteriaceae TaxID=49546 RepID=A0ABU7IXF5_9FLAO|nr:MULTISPECIES: sialate O-acetylesterase [Flavobacteriaceae]MAO15461.1 hypothetical protein [Allomuricauda sp.]MDC6390256.1 sialate O-acetylesterase [Maribacter sp. PR1]MEE1977646.1 sialate O-acetylesterase [Maribacter cobaltidurans]NDV43509.1 hypothetical protein [Allomuricauda sediminis]